MLTVLVGSAMAAGMPRGTRSSRDSMSTGSPSIPARDISIRVRTDRASDYFGLAISGANIYSLFVSTHYPSPTVNADEGGPVYYQQQVLAIVPRSTFEAGY
jgi:hypothetical protein